MLMSLVQMPLVRLVATVMALVLLAVAGVAPLAAQSTGDDLFSASIAVEPGSEQPAQIRQAMDAVLIKLTGQRGSPSDPRLAGLRADAQANLISFSYAEQLVPDGNFGERRLMLDAQFNRREIIRAMQRMGIELWSLERPEVLLWLAVEDEQRQRDMLAGDDRVHRFVLEQTAAARGLPLILPVQDQTDYSLIDADAIWGGFYENAELASERYATDRFVIAAASQRNSTSIGQAEGGWQVRWRLPGGSNGLETFVSQGVDLSAALEHGVHLLADRLAASAMVQSNADVSQTVRVILQQIHSPQQYAAASRVFKGMSQVRDVRLIQARGTEIELQLSLGASRDWLLQAIRLADDLSLADSLDDSDSGGAGSRPLRINVTAL